MLKTPKRVRNHVNPLAYTEEIFFNGFQNKKPIIMDIGSYRGEFGQKLVKKFSSKKIEEQKNFIFTEIRKPFSDYLEKLFVDNIIGNEKGEENVMVFGGNTAINIENILKNSIKNNVKIEKIFVNFPDPWFKKKHHKRRVVWGEFLDNLEKWLPKETEIIFQTDQEKLFKETMKEVIKRDFLEIKRFRDSIWGLTTYWEDRKIKEGSKIWRMKIFIKTKKNKRNIFEIFFDKFF